MAVKFMGAFTAGLCVSENCTRVNEDVDSSSRRGTNVMPWPQRAYGHMGQPWQPQVF